MEQSLAPRGVTAAALAAEIKHGCAQPGQVHTLYALRDEQILRLVGEGKVGVEDVRALDRTGRCIVASNHWALCSSEARNELLNDPHPHVRSCACVSHATADSQAA